VTSLLGTRKSLTFFYNVLCFDNMTTSNSLLLFCLFFYFLLSFPQVYHIFPTFTFITTWTIGEIITLSVDLFSVLFKS
jgi:hypothetical protein